MITLINKWLTLINKQVSIPSINTLRIPEGVFTSKDMQIRRFKVKNGEFQLKSMEENCSGKKIISYYTKDHLFAMSCGTLL